MADKEFTATIHSAIADIPSDAWDSLVPKSAGRATSPFSTHAFLAALEKSQCVGPDAGWFPQHVVMSDGNDIVAAMPLYAKTHSQGEYVFDHGWADAYERAGGNYYPKLQCAIPFTPASAPKLLTKDGSMELASALLYSAESLCERLGASSVHATFLDENDIATTEARGWLTRYDNQFHWDNRGYADFDAFLSDLSSRKRKAIKKERKAVMDAGVIVRWLTGTDITEDDWDAFYEFYMDTGSRKWGRPYLNRPFFSLLGQDMADDVLLMIAELDGRPVAGTLNLIGAETLFGRYWGCTEHIPFLHFELCYYQAIDFAIARGLTRVEAGAQGEHKLARGYSPNLTRSAHYIAHKGLRRAIADYLEDERRMVQSGQEMLDRHTPFRK